MDDERTESTAETSLESPKTIEDVTIRIPRDRCRFPKQNVEHEFDIVDVEHEFDIVGPTKIKVSASVDSKGGLGLSINRTPIHSPAADPSDHPLDSNE